MDEDKLHQPDDDFTSADASMMPTTSPYQPTTEPVPHRRSFIAGLVVDTRFVKSLPGFLKAIEILFSIAAAISMGCVSTCNPCGPVTFLQFISIFAIIVTFVLYVVFAFNFQSKSDVINWHLTDVGTCIAFFVLYVISCSILAANSTLAAERSGVAFGFMSAILYVASAWFAYKVFIVAYQKSNSAISHIKGVADKMETEVLS